MMNILCFLLAAALIPFSNGRVVRPPVQNGGDIMSNIWVVELETESKADEIAQKYGFKNLGNAGLSSINLYGFAKLDKSSSTGPIVQKLESYHDISSMISDPEVKSVYQEKLHKMDKKVFTPPSSVNDPLWQDQWTLNNSGQTNETNVFVDINVIGAWIQGYTGKGVLVAVVDDGVESTHDDLRNNHNAQNSYDYIDFDSNADPSSVFDSHGTPCAGEIAMVRSNNKCGVGVAYDSNIAGIRLIGAPVTEYQQTRAITHNRDAIDIYSNSWGPNDAGYFVSGPSEFLKKALQEGSEQGRNGLGNIFVWAAGNGGYYIPRDSCSADGYQQSIYTISVGALNEKGEPAYYDERCSAKMTAAYSANSQNDSFAVSTTAIENDCRSDFGGTSGATPYVSAVVALALEANPQLTWRDVQYLIAYTSNPDSLSSGEEFVNGAGLTVSHHFGFGAIDGEAMVTRARKWINVPSQLNDTIIPEENFGEAHYDDSFTVSLSYSGDIQYLEHIVVTLTLNVSNFTTPYDEEAAYYVFDNVTNYFTSYSDFIKRGDFKAVLYSPSDTNSTLIFPRPYDIVNEEGYLDWPVTSVLHWGENPNGQWDIDILWTNPYGGYGIVEVASVEFYGVSEVPESVRNIPAQCHSLCAGGCSGPLSSDCDSCNTDTIRNAITLECMQPSDCLDPLVISDGYCYLPSCGDGRVRNATTLECMQPRECLDPFVISDGDCYLPSCGVGRVRNDTSLECIRRSECVKPYVISDDGEFCSFMVVSPSSAATIYIWSATIILVMCLLSFVSFV